MMKIVLTLIQNMRIVWSFLRSIKIKQFYKYEEFIEDIEVFANKLKDIKIDTIVAVARGGLCLSHFLASKLNLRDVQSINAISYDKNRQSNLNIQNIPSLKNKTKILLVDDIADSGKTLQEVVKVLNNKYIDLDITTLTIFYKKTSIIKPDIYLHQNENWVEFFWEYE